MDIILNHLHLNSRYIQQTVYLSDIPNTNRETGSIFLFTVPSQILQLQLFLEEMLEN
jgi:hypothetical protein